VGKQQKDKRESSATTVLRFSEDHLWVRVDAGRAHIGLSDFGQGDLGEIVAAELPDVGEAVERGEPFGELESTRTVQELIAPVSGTVTAVNTDIEGSPTLINDDPYAEGWLIELDLSDDGELDDLMGVDEYDEFIAEDDHDA